MMKLRAVRRPLDARELVCQRARYGKRDYLVSNLHPVLVGLTTLEQWLSQRLQRRCINQSGNRTQARAPHSTDR
jgi:hypothetical protein